MKDSVYNKVLTGIHKTVISSEDTFKRIIITRDLNEKKMALDFFVAGYKYADGKDFISVIDEGEKLELVREVHNPFDCNAVAVYTYDYVKLGYVPRFISSYIAEQMSGNIQVKAKIKKINSRQSQSEDVRIETRIILPL